MYAGQKKVSNDIDKALKKEKSSAKSQAKKRDQKKALYYAKLKNVHQELRPNLQGDQLD